MELISVGKDRIPEAAATLATAMLDEPGGRWLLPDIGEFLDVHKQLLATTMTRALHVGRVDAVGDPLVGVAVWLERPAIDDESPGDAASAPTPPIFPEHALGRIEECDRTLRLMREKARPDRHFYLDSMGVLPDHRRRGIATQLLRAGLAAADAMGLPCALETLDADNVIFYRRRGFEVVAEEPVAGSNLTLRSMRRPPQS